MDENEVQRRDWIYLICILFSGIIGAAMIIALFAWLVGVFP
jgi:hypothetical protein